MTELALPRGEKVFDPPLDPGIREAVGSWLATILDAHAWRQNACHVRAGSHEFGGV